MKLKKYVRKTSMSELTAMFGFRPALLENYDPYIRVKKDGSIYNPKNPIIYDESEIEGFVVLKK